MFISNAVTYWDNVFFQIKLVLILLAGVNMFAFHHLVAHDMSGWQTPDTTPALAKAAGARIDAVVDRRRDLRPLDRFLQTRNSPVLTNLPAGRFISRSGARHTPFLSRANRALTSTFYLPNC